MDAQLQLQMLTSELASIHMFNSRKGPKFYTMCLKVPYVVHPLDVLRMLQRLGFHNPEDHFVMWKAALFHDVLEDTTFSYENLVNLIGDQAAAIVLELTKYPDEDKDHYLSSFANKSDWALAIKVADRLCNVLDYKNDGNINYAAKYMMQAKPIFDLIQDTDDHVIKESHYIAMSVLINYILIDLDIYDEFCGIEGK